MSTNVKKCRCSSEFINLIFIISVYQFDSIEYMFSGFLKICFPIYLQFLAYIKIYIKGEIISNCYNACSNWRWIDCYFFTYVHGQTFMAPVCLIYMQFKKRHTGYGPNAIDKQNSFFFLKFLIENRFALYYIRLLPKLSFFL